MITTVTPFGTAVAPGVAAFAVFPIAGATAVLELVAAAVAPFALGEEVSLHVVGVEQAAPVGVADGIDAGLDAVESGLLPDLFRGGEGGGGLSGLAEHRAGGKQSLEGDQGTFHLL